MRPPELFVLTLSSHLFAILGQSYACTPAAPMLWNPVFLHRVANERILTLALCLIWLLAFVVLGFDAHIARSPVVLPS